MKQFKDLDITGPDEQLPAVERRAMLTPVEG